MAERAFLVIVELDTRYMPGDGRWSVEDEARELDALVTSAGCQVVGHLIARRHQPVAGTFLGSGKLQEIAELARECQSQVVILNQELSSAQQRNIEDLVQVKTIDRTQLILDIFAQRARSQEGQVQVELAQLRYLLPRLVGKGIMLSRLGGGIGTRGPGEQKLEVDRRRIRARIGRLERALEQLARRRQATRSKRKEAGIAVAALVGYTNAGKTTLLNRLTGAGAPAHAQLFTTLDPLARRLRLPARPDDRGAGGPARHGELTQAGGPARHGELNQAGGPGGDWVVITDTVGFLHHLPHQLIEAFKATLEEARDADLLLHVLDASHPLASAHAEAVEVILRQLALQEKPVLTILNKRDQVAEPHRLLALEQAYAPAVAISAKTGEGVDHLLALLRDHLMGSG